LGFDPAHSCGITNVAVDGLAPGELAGWLWREHRIIVMAIGHADCPGLRITPSVHTTTEELERFVDAMKLAMREGVT
jgi:selenocysteine lyase/cysteine desulfurase